jgi:hypothetical protein
VDPGERDWCEFGNHYPYRPSKRAAGSRLHSGISSSWWLPSNPTPKRLLEYRALTCRLHQFRISR